MELPIVPQRLRQRPKIAIISVGITCVIGLFLIFRHGLLESYVTSLRGSHRQTQSPYLSTAPELWQKLHPLLDKYAPMVPAPQIISDAESLRYDANKQPELMNKTVMSLESVVGMADAHRGFLRGINEQLPTFTTTKGVVSRGIVTVAGGFYWPVFMVSLRMLRKTGCKLPVEVFLANGQEYEAELCENILPTLNAKCRILADIFNPHNSSRHTLGTYQYKIFSILFSDFHEVLFLDADSFPLHDPDTLFSQEPFKSNGMVTWPDFWASSISPAYYLISGRPPSSFTGRASTESGQLLVRKRTHFHALLLAAYYNYHGPSYYYPLLCQGGAGRGDKGTFLPAAIVLDLPFYATSEPVLGIGHEEGGHLYTFAMIQHDPVQDYELTSKNIWRNRDPSVGQPPRPLFLHTNTPKWNAKNIFDHPGPYDLTLKHGAQVGAYVDPPEAVATIAGVERQIWDAVKWVGCDLRSMFKEWKDEHDICSNIQHHFDTVLEVH